MRISLDVVLATWVIFGCLQGGELSPCQGPIEYSIGVGISDITGPAADVNMMGYGMITQTSNGIHLRQFSRSIIIVDNQTGLRTVFVSIDAGMVDQEIKSEAIKRLNDLYGELYSEENVLISGTHTHSGPGGFMTHYLYQITSFGFIPQTFNAIKNGIVKSIVNAHNDLEQGCIYWNQGTINDANINRSPASYLENPEGERNFYGMDTDTTMTLLKLVDVNGNPKGMVNWYAVHGTSMNKSNGLISSDNKGYASILFEQEMNPPGTPPGKGKFVAIFGQTNEGDVSPNIKGPICIDSGFPCDFNTSTCNGRNQMCIAFGPGENMFDSTKIIGSRQFVEAKALFDTAIKPVSGPLRFVHQYLDMEDQSFELPNGEKVTTCTGAMGYSFGAGTTDGPGDFDFHQNTRQGEENVFWQIPAALFTPPDEEMNECHYPKPILLTTGKVKLPYDWTPGIVPTQIFILGNIVLLGAPAELTTMSGRRLRNAVHEVLTEDNSIFPPEVDVVVLIAGLANGYSHYVTTFEEYQFQRYEGASTLYGPYTLDYYIRQYQYLAKSFSQGSYHPDVPSGPYPPQLLDKEISLLPPPPLEVPPLGKKMGDVIKNPENSYKQGSVVDAIFVCGNPRNNLMTGSTFLTVEFKDPSASWTLIATDANWETKFIWKSSLAYSKCTVEWEIPWDGTPGKYRICHQGYYTSLLLIVKGYSGCTKEFMVESE